MVYLILVCYSLRAPQNFPNEVAVTVILISDIHRRLDQSQKRCICVCSFIWIERKKRDRYDRRKKKIK